MKTVSETATGPRVAGPGAGFDAGPVIEPVQESVADIALLLEGTYPYVRGGVSSWVHQIITALPEIRFAVVFIGSEPSMYGPAQYQFPGNVTHVETHYLLRQDRHGLDGSLSVFYKAEGFTEGEGEIETLVALGRRFQALSVAANFVYGQDPEGNERRAQTFWKDPSLLQKLLKEKPEG